MPTNNESYKNAGVDVTAGYRAVELMKTHIDKTKTDGVLSGIGGFGGLFKPNFSGISSPVLVSGTDGVGTKLKIAFILDKHDTVGIDCVAMCANDVACSGAKPLFFLDYIAAGKNVPEKIERIVKGVSDGCVQAGCALIGGETAEMPGFYPENEYDLAGFCVGLADEKKIIDGSSVKKGDAIIGIASSGVHSNGFSLIRSIININDQNLRRFMSEFNKTLGEELLTPTKIYVKSILSLAESYNLKAISHITGGGFYENIPRMLGAGMGAKIEKSALPVAPIFQYIQSAGNVPEDDMYNTFNMGIGLCIVTPPEDVSGVMETIKETGEEAYVIGEVIESDKDLIIC